VKIINLRSLDLLRGLVATYVVLGHCRWLLWAGQEAWVKGHHGWVANLFAYASSLLRYGHAAVMIFFVLSGFFIHLRVAPAFAAGSKVMFNAGDFLKRRAHRLLAPYVFALLITVVADTVGRHFFPVLYEARTGDSFLDYNFARKEYNLQSIGPALLFLPGSLGIDFGTNGPLWSLAYEIIYYLLYPFWLLVRRLGFIPGYGTGALLGFLALIGHQVLFLTPVLAYYPVWLAGAAMAETLSRGFHVGRVGILAGVSALAGFTAIQFSLPFPGTILAYLFLGGGVVGFFACFPQRFAASRWHRVGEELGIRSYSIYILHFPLVTLISAWAFSEWGGRPLTGWLAAGGAFLVLGICLLGFQICERHFLHARLRPPRPQNLKSE
jgi:peptidoglycan/LPS O-acetylase OafA/YrhL